MDRHKLILLFHTIRFLRFRQIYYRLFHFIRGRFFKKDYRVDLPKDPAPIVWQGGISNSSSYLNDNSFRFLNITQSFGENIDWNFDGLGKLWTYNLNYFDFLNQHQIDQDKARKLVEDYIEKDNSLKDGHEPYPISLRGINWIKFLAKNRISSSSINQKLYQHYLRLKDNLEYHLLGNHLLENGYSMLFGAYYFENENFYGIAHKILKKELNEQILEDGAHFELSPMYHQILLHRLLDCINLIKNNPWKKDDLLAFLFGKAKNMAGWLKAITYKNGNVPMVNDCAYDIAPTSDQLLDYAKELEIRFDETILGESGYRMIQVKDYEMFIDVGNIGPDYQPGHAHSDTFSFELLLKKKPFIVDVGTSTYEKNEIRHRERQTSSHNTVMVEDKDQSQVWDGFRVARRARIAYLKEGSDTITSAHDGYKSIGVLHERSFNMANSIIIRDKILCKRGHKIASKAYFHFHPSIKRIEIDKKQVVFEGTKALIDFEGEINDIKLQEYEYCAGFNKTEPAQKVCVSFARELKTTILL